MQFKNWIWATGLLICITACKGPNKQNAVNIDVNGNEAHKVAYAYGVYVAQQMKNQGFLDINQEAFRQGIGDQLAEKDLLVHKDSIFPILQTFSEKKAKEKAEKSKQEGIDFLAKNKEKDGVKVTESGLQYEVLVEGDGPSPGLEDKVSTHYHGTLIDGTVFDSSVERGQPATFPVNGVIPGWTEALQMMKTGAKWKLYIPSELAYGERGAGASIGPNSTLIFEVELLEIKPKE